MYTIIGGDGREYGPIGLDQLREWIAQGRANGATRVKKEDGAWTSVAELPEFTDSLGRKTFPPPLPEGADGPALRAQLAAMDYNLEIGACISAGWRLLTDNLGLLIGGTALILVIEVAIGILGMIPILGILIGLASFAVAGPFKGGLFWLFLRQIRGRTGEINDIFAGFRRGFVQLMLTGIVSTLLTGVAALPGAVLVAIAAITLGLKGAGPGLIVLLLGILLALVPVIYLGVSWMFSYFLAIDKLIGFWDAMELSRRMVSKHWGNVFALVIVVGLLNMLGMLLCGVGLFFTLPLGIGALSYAYELIFNQRSPPAR